MTTVANIDPSEAISSDVAAPTPVSPPVEAPPAPGPRVSLLREPLLHFVLLGGLLFAGDRVLMSRRDDPHRIVVSSEVNTEAVETFRASRGRAPNPEELRALDQVWIDNEVLYREGLALQVDKGDAAIRERVIFKALSVVDSNVKLPPADEAVVRKWFEAHRDKYDEPPRYDFDEAALSGENSEAAVRDFVTQLNNGTPGDAKAGLRVFKGRPLQNLVQSYGQELTDALVKAPVGQWQALKTRDGWRAMRLNAANAAKPADFAAIRGVVTQDWKDAIGSEQRSAAVHELAKKYQITFEAPVEHGSPE